MNRIKQVIKDKGLKIQDLASKLGVSRNTLHNQMNGNPSLKKLQEIAEAIDCDVHELIDTTEDYAHFYDKNQWLGIRKK